MSTVANQDLIQGIIDNNVHIGSLKKFSHPKTRPYQLGIQNGITIINPEIIAQQLENAKQRVQLALSEKKEILIVCEKSVFADQVKDFAEKFNCHYFNYNVPSGILTNFDTLVQRIKSMNVLSKFIESEEFVKITKKEQLTKKRELKKVQRIYQGVQNLSKIPDLVIVIDGKSMFKLIREVDKMKKESIVLSSTDFNQFWSEDDLVISNVNNYYSLLFVCNYLFNIA
jgi:small subunit ribosomal protein S2